MKIEVIIIEHKSLNLAKLYNSYYYKDLIMLMFKSVQYCIKGILITDSFQVNFHDKNMFMNPLKMPGFLH